MKGVEMHRLPVVGEGAGSARRATTDPHTYTAHDLLRHTAPAARVCEPSHGSWAPSPRTPLSRRDPNTRTPPACAPV